MDIIVYNLNHKWQKFLPNFIIKLFIKPVIFKDCILNSCDMISSNIESHSIDFTIGEYDYKESK